jgi:hypothetical protein
MTIPRVECCLPFVALLNSDTMIGVSQIELGKELGPYKAVHKSIDPR